MGCFDELQRANESYAETFEYGERPALPARRVAVITCMDARLHPERFLGLAVGDANVIRNAGGRASEDVIRSLVISQRLLGTNEVIVIHHTDCGMMKFSNEDLAEKVRRELGTEVGNLDFLPFRDLEQSVRDDVETLRSSPLIPRDIAVSGAIYDVKTGRLHAVVRA